MNGFVAPDEEVAQSSGGFIAPDEETTQWSDLPKNIIPDATAIGKGALGTAERIGKGVMDIPSDTVESIKDEWGGNFSNTPIMQDLKTVGGGVVDAVKGIPQQLENLGSKDAWVQHPVQNAITAGSIVAPLISPEGVTAESLAGKMEKTGGRLAADIGDVSGKTVERVRPEVLGEEAQANIRRAGKTPNVSDVRTEIGKKLVNDKVVGGLGQDIGDRLQQVNERENTAGQNVEKALQDIRDANLTNRRGTITYDVLQRDANPILKSVLDKANDLESSADPEDIAEGKSWRVVYNSLADKAMADTDSSLAGKLSLDDIRNEMQRVGHRLGNATKDSEKYNIYRGQYAHLADIRDSMVEAIAKETKSPDLARNLVDANREYTLYNRIAHDIQNVAKSGQDRGVGSYASRQIMYGRPFRAAIAGIMDKISPALAQKLISSAPLMRKWGPYLESAAKQGPRNLAIADYLIRQNEQDK